VYKYENMSLEEKEFYIHKYQIYLLRIYPQKTGIYRISPQKLPGLLLYDTIWMQELSPIQTQGHQLNQDLMLAMGPVFKFFMDF